MVLRGSSQIDVHGLNFSCSFMLQKILLPFSHIQKTINLLSVNAAIEARRAGDAGAGFAAIARAIKDLVAQSEKSTNECKAELQKMEEIKTNMRDKDKNFISLN